MKDIIRNASS